MKSSGGSAILTFLGLATPASAICCTAKVPQTQTPPAAHAAATTPANGDIKVTEAHRQGLAHGARAEGLAMKNLSAAIDEYRLAIKADPTFRQWKESLAFTLYRAKRTSEAIPLWKKLATGNDDTAKHAAHWLTKTSTVAAQAPK